MRQFQPLPVFRRESGEAAGGYDVTITGSGFESNATVYFAGLLVSPLAQSETEIIVSAPAGQPNLDRSSRRPKQRWSACKSKLCLP